MKPMYITIGFPHGENPKPKVIKGTEVPYEDHMSYVRSLDEKFNEDFQRVVVCEVGTIRVEDRWFITKAEQKRREKQHKEQVLRSYKARQEQLKKEAKERGEEFKPEPLPEELREPDAEKPKTAEK